MIKSLPCMGVIYRKEDIMLTLKEFQNYAKETLYLHMLEEYKDVEVTEIVVTKTNDQVLHGINVRANKETVAPTIYLDGYFKEYEEGADLDTVFDKIANVAVQHLSVPSELKNIGENYQDFNFIKERVVFSVVNTKRNKKLLSDTVHKEFEDLSLIYKVVLNTDDNGVASITVKDNHLDNWGVSIDELHKYAVANTKELLPVTIKSMNEVMKEMFREDDMPAEMADMMFEEMPPTQQMYVISNSKKVNGAASMLYVDELFELSKKIGTSLYILPSSVHEVIAVSTEMGNPETLSEMVREVNDTQVSEEEQLSDHVYFFNADTKELKIA